MLGGILCPSFKPVLRKIGDRFQLFVAFETFNNQIDTPTSRSRDYRSKYVLTFLSVSF